MNRQAVLEVQNELFSLQVYSESQTNSSPFILCENDGSVKLPTVIIVHLLQMGPYISV